MSNFAMGTILGKGFAQAQVHTEFIAREPKALVCYELFVWKMEKKNLVL